jgi:hypothetical protein
MVEPGQDLLLAALSESGISPNDLFDVDGGDAGLATPTPPSVQQVTVFQTFQNFFLICSFNCYLLVTLVIFFLFVVLRIKHRDLCMLGNHFTAEVQP